MALNFKNQRSLTVAVRQMEREKSMADLVVTGLLSYFSRWFFFWCHKDMIQIVAGHHCSSCVKHHYR